MDNDEDIEEVVMEDELSQSECWCTRHHSLVDSGADHHQSPTLGIDDHRLQQLHSRRPTSTLQQTRPYSSSIRYRLPTRCRSLQTSREIWLVPRNRPRRQGLPGQH